MTTRRQVMQGLPAIWLASSAPVNAQRKPSLEEQIAGMVAELEETHGGAWNCRQSSSFLLFQREIS